MPLQPLPDARPGPAPPSSGSDAARSSGPRPAARRDHRLAWALGGLAALAILAAAACTWWPMPSSLAARMIGERLHRTVRIEGDASFCLCPKPSVRAASIEIGPPDWSERGRFAKLEDLEIAIHPLALLRGRVHVASLVVGRGDVLLERTADGRASWQFGPPAGDAGQAQPPDVDRLEARDVTWRLIDPGRQADLDGTLSLVDGAGRPGPDGTTEAPRLDVRAGGTLRELPVIARIEGGGVLPSGDAGPRPIRVRARVGEGRLAFDGQADALASLQGLTGSFDVRGPALAALGALFGAVLPRTPPFRIEGRLAHAERRWELDVARAHVGGSDLRGKVVFVPAVAGASARLDGRLEGQRIRVVDLGRSVGFGEAKADGRDGRVLPDVPLDLPSLRNMDAKLAIAIDRLELGGTAAPITALAADLRLENGILALGSLKAAVAGGQLGGAIRIDATDKPGRMSASLTLRNVALERWLPKLRGEPPLSSRMNAELELAGRGTSVAQVLGRADGHARIALGPGQASRLAMEVAGLDIAESLAVLATHDRSVRLDCGLVDFAVERGVATPRVMFVDTRDTIVTGQGSVDLSRERINLRLRAAPRDFSPLTVRSPVDVQGTFADPSVSVDKTRVAGTVIASVLLGAVVSPIAALLPLLDFGEGDPPSPCTERYAQAAMPAATPKDARR